MKNINAKSIVGALVVASFVVSSLPMIAFAVTPPNWNVSGAYVVNFVLGAGTYAHDMNLTQSVPGIVTGSGGYPVGGPYAYHWNVTSGSVAGDTISLTSLYDVGAAGTVMHMTGTIAPNGSMSGVWDDNFGGFRTGTWSTASGVAVALVAPTVPVITLPSSNSCVTSANQLLIDWTDSVGLAPIKYQYQAFSDSAYTALIYDSGITLTASQIPTPGTPDGVYFVRVRAQDANGLMSNWSNGALNPFKITVSSTFTATALLAPINISGKTFKLGSTIPVKFQVMDACGGGVNMGIPTLTITGPSAVPANAFRFDASAGQYISNWSTKMLSAGTYTITVGALSGVSGLPFTTSVTLTP